MFIVFSFHNKKATLAFKWLDAENYTTRDSAVYFSARGFYFTAIQPFGFPAYKISLYTGVTITGSYTTWINANLSVSHPSPQKTILQAFS